MIVGIPKETRQNEKRVAISPAAVERLKTLGFVVQIESGAGIEAKFPDEVLAKAGAQIIAGRQQLLSSSDIIFKVQPPQEDEVETIQPNALLISFVWPAKNEALVKKLAERKLSTLAMDCIPRVTRAQKMDALSSMGNIAGYRAVIEAANAFGSVFTGQITAAGKMPPAKVLVIGAGVAGLAAIGAANGLGAIVRAFDTRLAVKEQVMSMGADFLELQFDESGEGEGGYAKQMSEEFLRKEMELFAAQAKEVDIIITTALIPGKPAPRLITAEMVKSMRQGSVIVDMAAEQGGNCELTEVDQSVNKHGVTIIGYSDLPSRLPTQASKLYANNLTNLLAEITIDKTGETKINLEDTVVRGALITHQGQITWPPPKIEQPQPAVAAAKQQVKHDHKSSEASSAAPPISRGMLTLAAATFAAISLLVLGALVPPDFLARFTVFVLSCFVGWQVVWNVTPALHSPLMSVTNAISGIIVIGAILQVKASASLPMIILSSVAITIAMINVSGGFLITQRMLSMFRK